MASSTGGPTPGRPQSRSPSPEAGIETTDFAPDSELRSGSDTAFSSPTPVQGHIDTNVSHFPAPAPNVVQTPSVHSSWSATSDRQIGHGSQADPADRVFPIRSVISVDPKNRPPEQEYFPRMSSESAGSRSFSRPSHPRPDPELATRRHGSIASDTVFSPPALMSPPIPATDGRRRNNTTGARSSVQADAERHGSTGINLFANLGSDDDGSEYTEDMRSGAASSVRPDTPGLQERALDGLMTTRFKHVVTDEGHHIITGKEGTLQRCEDEPIHTPGAVQAFGLMLAIREEPDGRFTVRYASENSKRIIGYKPLQLFRLNNFTDILTEEQADNLLDHIDFIRDEDADPAINGPEVFSMSIRPPKKRYVNHRRLAPACPCYCDRSLLIGFLDRSNCGVPSTYTQLTRT